MNQDLEFNILVAVAGIAIGAVIMFFVIKEAVKAGIKQEMKEIKDILNKH